jgi:hypothetical protein
MKKILLLMIAAVSLMTALNADEPQSFIDAINATSEAREILIKELQEADMSNVRSQYTGCPTAKQFAKILADEKRYNAAARVWLRHW